MSENNAKEKRRIEAEEAAKKKKKYTWVKIVVALCLVLCLALTVMESSFINRLVPAVTVDDTTYTAAEYNWLYTNSFYGIYNSLYSTYGDYTSYILDRNTSLKEQQYSEDMTWADFIGQQTEETVRKMTALTKAADEAGYVLDDETKAQIDSEWESIVSTAESYSLSANDFLVQTYGKGVNEKVFKDMFERYLYAFSYADEVQDDFEITSEEIDAKYEANPNDYDAVTYKYYYVSSSAADGEDEQTAKDNAEDIANEILGAENSEQYVKDELDAEFTEVRYSKYASAVSEYADWLFDSARKSGDKEVFETSSGFYVVIYGQKEDLHYNTVSVRHILVKPEDTTSEESWEEAKEKLEGYQMTWNDLGGGENNFASIAMAYSEDSGSASSGGLYTNIYKGAMVKEFEDWCFNSSRKEGDSEIIKSSYGYHLMYFVGVGNDYYTSVLDSEIRSEKYSEYIESITSGYELKNEFGKSMTAKHF